MTKYRQPDSLTFGTHTIELWHASDGRTERVVLVKPETSQSIDSSWPLGFVQKNGSSWAAVDDSGRSRGISPDRAEAVRSLVKAFEAAEELQRRRERRRLRGAMFKTTLVMWSKKRPTLGSKSSAAEIVAHIGRECQAGFVYGPNTELVEDPSADPEHGFIFRRKRGPAKKGFLARVGPGPVAPSQ